MTVTHLENCNLCHTTLPDLQPGIPAGGGDCAACHGGTWDVEHTPAIDHTALVTVGTTDCANCHNDTLVSAAAETHNACGSCHDADGGLVGTAIGTNFTAGGDCTTCHTSTWESTASDHRHRPRQPGHRRCDRLCRLPHRHPGQCGDRNA